MSLEYYKSMNELQAEERLKEISDEIVQIKRINPVNDLLIGLLEDERALLRTQFIRRVS